MEVIKKKPKVEDTVKIVKQETVSENGETKIKYTLSDGGVQYKGL